MKGKERVPVPVAGPAFGSGVKFVMFYVLGSFLQPAPEIVSVQGTLSPVCDPRLEEGKGVERPFQNAYKQNKYKHTYIYLYHISLVLMCLYINKYILTNYFISTNKQPMLLIGMLISN